VTLSGVLTFNTHIPKLFSRRKQDVLQSRKVLFAQANSGLLVALAHPRFKDVYRNDEFFFKAHGFDEIAKGSILTEKQ
jgi:hypothetical protein